MGAPDFRSTPTTSPGDCRTIKRKGLCRSSIIQTRDITPTERTNGSEQTSHQSLAIRLNRQRTDFWHRAAANRRVKVVVGGSIEVEPRDSVVGCASQSSKLPSNQDFAVRLKRQTVNSSGCAWVKSRIQCSIRI